MVRIDPVCEVGRDELRRLGLISDASRAAGDELGVLALIRGDVRGNGSAPIRTGRGGTGAPCGDLGPGRVM